MALGVGVGVDVGVEKKEEGGNNADADVDADVEANVNLLAIGIESCSTDSGLLLTHQRLADRKVVYYRITPGIDRRLGK